MHTSRDSVSPVCKIKKNKKKCKEDLHLDRNRNSFYLINKFEGKYNKLSLVFQYSAIFDLR